MQPGAIEKWAPRLGLVDFEWTGPGQWTAIATWAGDKLISKTDDETDDDFNTWVQWPSDRPHRVTCDGTEILCNGMERQLWTPLEFIALAMGYRKPDGSFDTDRG